jgi:hypothetical protein
MSRLLEKLDALPPCLVRLIARDPKHPGRRLPLMDIAKRAGLSYGTTARLSLKRTWGNTPPWIIDAYCAACGVDILHPKRSLQYLKRTLSHPNGYKLLANKSGAGSARSVLKLLQTLYD